MGLAITSPLQDSHIAALAYRCCSFCRDWELMAREACAHAENGASRNERVMNPHIWPWACKVLVLMEGSATAIEQSVRGGQGHREEGLGGRAVLSICCIGLERVCKEGNEAHIK